MGIRRTLVVVYHISQMISAAVMGFPHAHGVVGEVDIAVVALDAWLVGGWTRLSDRNLQKSAWELVRVVVLGGSQLIFRHLESCSIMLLS